MCDSPNPSRICLKSSEVGFLTSSTTEVSSFFKSSFKGLRRVLQCCLCVLYILEHCSWIVLRKRVGIRPLLIDKLSSIPIPQDGAIAPEGFVLLPIVEKINYQYDDQLPISRSPTNITITYQYHDHLPISRSPTNITITYQYHDQLS